MHFLVNNALQVLYHYVACIEQCFLHLIMLYSHRLHHIGYMKNKLAI